MNDFIVQFVQECISEIQHIPCYHEIDGKVVGETLKWFSDEELEEILKNSNEKVADHLKRQDIDWVLEKSEFADDIERIIMIHMATECLWRVVNDKRLEQRFKRDSRLEGLITPEMRETLHSVAYDYKKCMDEHIEEVIQKGQQDPAMPKVSQPE